MCFKYILIYYFILKQSSSLSSSSTSSLSSNGGRAELVVVDVHKNTEREGGKGFSFSELPKEASL